MNINLNHSIWKGQKGTLHPYYPKEQMSLISWQRFPCEEDIKQELKMAQDSLLISYDKDCNKMMKLYRINLFLL